ncbi:MAG: hypothetical protein AB1488_09610 [Nitrospirota bacterium]
MIDNSLPKNKRADRLAFEEMIELDKQGIIEIGIPISSTMIEERGAGAEKHQLLKERMGTAYRLWPAAVSQKMHSDIKRKKKCLQEIMQDKEGIDSPNLLVSTIYTPYYVTTDYRYCRNFKAQLTKIRKKCDINVFVLTPSEFMKKYKSGGFK